MYITQWVNGARFTFGRKSATIYQEKEAMA